MQVLLPVFGPSKAEVWGQISQRIGAPHVERGFLHGGTVVEVEVGAWTVLLDTYTLSTGKTHTTYTRLRAPFANADGFRFAVYREGFVWKPGRLLDMQGVEVGHPELDRDFAIRGNDAGRLRALFADARFRDLLQAQPYVHFEVKDDEGFFGAEFPRTSDELCFSAYGVIKEVDRLRGLFELFAATLDRLTRMGSAYDGERGLRF